VRSILVYFASKWGQPGLTYLSSTEVSLGLRIYLLVSQSGFTCQSFGFTRFCPCIIHVSSAYAIIDLDIKQSIQHIEIRKQTSFEMGIHHTQTHVRTNAQTHAHTRTNAHTHAHTHTRSHSQIIITYDDKCKIYRNTKLKHWLLGNYIELSPISLKDVIQHLVVLHNSCFEN